MSRDANEETKHRVWMLLSFAEEQQYAGNEGYAEDPRTSYRYDSFVPNHKKLASADTVIIRDRKRAIGIAVVQEVTLTTGTKTLLRCPVCGTTGIKQRKAANPKFRCNNKHTFAAPTPDVRTVTMYEAHFGTSFIPLAGSISVEELRSTLVGNSGQLSIQAVDPEALRSKLAHSPIAQELLISLAAMPPLARTGRPRKQLATNEDARPLILAGTDADDGPFDPHDAKDARGKTLREIRARRGQRQFRNALLAAYGNRCAMTGCAVLHVLEAAHITPYLGPYTNHVTNGILLRADLHTLFDNNFVTVEPKTRTIWISPSIEDPAYRALHGKQLLETIDSASAPSAAALRKQHDDCYWTTADLS